MDVGKTKQTATQLPDVEKIRYQFRDAYSVIRCASRVLQIPDNQRVEYDREDRHSAVSALNQGVEALHEALDRLERAEMAINRVLRPGGSV